MLVNDAVEIWVYTEIANEVWVPELDRPVHPDHGRRLADVRLPVASALSERSARERRQEIASPAGAAIRNLSESRQLHPAPRPAHHPDVVRGVAADVRAVADRARRPGAAGGRGAGDAGDVRANPAGVRARRSAAGSVLELPDRAVSGRLGPLDPLPAAGAGRPQRLLAGHVRARPLCHAHRGR